MYTRAMYGTWQKQAKDLCALVVIVLFFAEHAFYFCHCYLTPVENRRVWVCVCC